ncbi:MAG: thiol peroxidase [Phycisphaeraceae bacterium]|nr:thiol peroxidase [Phycisphaeraceae bacterium]
MAERTGLVTFKGGPVTLEGQGVKVGGQAPNFTGIAMDFSGHQLSDYKGKTVVLLSVPSVDTPVCDTEVRRFNEEATKLGGDVVVLSVSLDLPPALKRWCGAAGIDRVTALSDFKDLSFAKGWGLRIKELGLLARTVYIIDPAGTIVYEQIVPEIAQEPDYDAALKAASKVAG